MSLFQSQQSVDESQKLTGTESSIPEKPETETPLETSGKDSESEYNTADEETESQVQVSFLYKRLAEFSYVLSFYLTKSNSKSTLILI